MFLTSPNPRRNTLAVFLFSNIRGLCVGGLNHNLFCGSSLDCPSKKYNDSSGETVEYGVCVGATLDTGKAIPKSGNPDGLSPAGQWRLYELFVNKYATWLWNDATGSYAVPEGPDDHSGPIAWDAPGTGVSEWKVNSTPPVVFDITVNDKASGSVPLSSAASTAILRFFAYADNDQMPIVRLAVDWGDGEPYVMQGWFKNRKKYCNTTDNKVCQSDNYIYFNQPCKTINDCGGDSTKCSADKTGNRLYFGNSPSACEEGYYQFTHIYECKSGGAGWDAATKSCKFTPKVQVLDNWGWCNSSDGKGKWNDNETDPKNDDKRNCYTGSNTNNPWTSFGGMIEVKP